MKTRYYSVWQRAYRASSLVKWTFRTRWHWMARVVVFFAVGLCNPFRRVAGVFCADYDAPLVECERHSDPLQRFLRDQCQDLMFRNILMACSLALRCSFAASTIYGQCSPLTLVLPLLLPPSPFRHHLLFTSATLWPGELVHMFHNTLNRHFPMRHVLHSSFGQDNILHLLSESGQE
jgi:hypothetical protein